MSTPILATKLYLPPRRPRIVLRPRLVERLNEGVSSGCKLTLVSAPAGFGKTTLVSEWVAGSARPVAWVSLDAGDDDPARFLAYFVAALQTISAGIGAGVLAALESPQPPPTESVLTTLLNEIAAIAHHFILVLDDYHVIEAKAVDQALAFLLEHQPPTMHLVIATREDPSLPLARLRARGQLTELRAVDLRFTPAEAADFLNQVMGLNLSAEDIAALETRTEGWIAGLQLAALSMRGHVSRDTTTFIQSFTGSHRFALDYLVEEVLGQQSESVQAFLLRTSILDRMCGPLCDAVLLDRSAPGQETLEYLEHANLFIVPLDDERRWYRYHHLFGDLLRQRLSQAQGLPEYHLRASVWCEANDDIAEAFQHAFAAGDFERAARLAEAAWQSMERSFRTVAWLGWTKKLPHAAICSRPWLCVQMGWALSDVGELEPSETYLQDAERSLDGMRDQEEFKSIPGTIALIRAGNAQIAGNLAETVKFAELSIQLTPENDIFLRAQAAMTLGFTRWATGDVEASLQAMRTWMEEMQKVGNQMYVIASAFVVADMHVILGRLGEAERVLRQTIQQAVAFSQEAESVTAHHHLGLALLAHERGDEMGAIQRLQTTADLGQRTTLVDWPYRWNLAQARLKASVGEWDAALLFLDEAKRVYVKNPIPMLQPVEALKAQVYLKQGRLDKAQAWARERRLLVTDKVNYLGEYEYLTLARVCLAERSFEGISDLLERLLTLAETQKRTGSVIKILLTQALAHQTQGHRVHAIAALERALELAEPEGFVRLFVDEGPPMAQLLSEAAARGIMPDYTNRLLAAFGDLTKDEGPTTKLASTAAQSGTPSLVEPLSGRELEILRLITQGLSNREIGERLFLALDTVKGHNRHIFDKLQVQSRTEAIARARELDLS